MPHTGLQPKGYINPFHATWLSLLRLYKGIPTKIELTISIQQRNGEIRQRYRTGEESIPDLAKIFNLSNARIHQILHE